MVGIQYAPNLNKMKRLDWHYQIKKKELQEKWFAYMMDKASEVDLDEWIKFLKQ